MSTERTRPEFWLTDMDGVLVHEEKALPGAVEFLDRLVEKQRRFLVLTNNSIFTPRDLAARLARTGLHVPEESIWTSALATANFLSTQLPSGSAYVIGEAGMTTALHEVGYTLTDTDPDYVVLGETRTYSFEAITRAVRLIGKGARFIATNPDVTGPSPEGPLPATGSVAAMITRATASTRTRSPPSWSATAWTPTSSPASRRAWRRCSCCRARPAPPTSPASRSGPAGSATRSPT
jgi:NagD protein